jgi:hypothetical protein
MAKVDLRIDWATHEAARYACENWHYSGTVPVGKLAKVGAWERGEFVGVVLFAWGMNKNLGSPYGLNISECCELVRVALRKHVVPVSRILAFALRFLKAQSPGVRCVVSFADPTAGHHGGIYQAGNWIYAGQSAGNYEWRLHGKRLNKRAYTGVNFGSPRLDVPAGAVRVPLPGKHRYLMPLDEAMRAQIAPLAKPYPKRAKEQAGGHPSPLGGVTPTRTLQSNSHAP